MLLNNTWINEIKGRNQRYLEKNENDTQQPKTYGKQDKTVLKGKFTVTQA